jgi:hypothetical protein
VLALALARSRSVRRLSDLRWLTFSFAIHLGNFLLLLALELALDPFLLNLLLHAHELALVPVLLTLLPL